MVKIFVKDAWVNEHFNWICMINNQTPTEIAEVFTSFNFKNVIKLFP